MSGRVMYLLFGGGAAMVGVCVMLVLEWQARNARRRLAEAQRVLDAARRASEDRR